MKKSNKVIVPDMFGPVKIAIANYKAEADLLDQQEAALQSELTAMQQELTEALLDQEKASVEDRVNARVRQQEITQRSQIIYKVLEEMAEERHELKLKYVDIYKDALNPAADIRSQFEGNEIVDRYLGEMFLEITDISRQMGEQYREVSADLSEIFQDEKVGEKFRNLHRHYTHENYQPSFWHNNNTVLHKQEVILATSGNIPPNFKQQVAKAAAANE